MFAEAELGCLRNWRFAFNCLGLGSCCVGYLDARISVYAIWLSVRWLSGRSGLGVCDLAQCAMPVWTLGLNVCDLARCCVMAIRTLGSRVGATAELRCEVYRKAGAQRVASRALPLTLPCYTPGAPRELSLSHPLPPSTTRHAVTTFEI